MFLKNKKNRKGWMIITSIITIYSLRLVKEKSHKYEVSNVIKSPDDAADIFNQVLDMQNLPNEIFAMICLNTKNKVAGLHIISIGNLNGAIVHPREIFKAAMLNNSAAIIVGHNHPSGDTTPSREDIQITKRLIEAGEILGIEVLDHIIIGEGFRSLRDTGDM
jgi:DNA repair protein RadC